MKDNKIKSGLFRVCMTFLLPVVIYVVFVCITRGAFGGAMALQTIARQSIIPIIIAMSISFDKMQGTWDFSAGSVVYASAIIGANIGSPYGMLGVIVCCMAVAVILSIISGLAYTLLKIPVLILSIGALMLYESLPRILFKTGGVVSMTIAKVAQPPYCFIVFGAVFVFFYVVNKFSLFGHNIRAIGANQAVAYSAGVDIVKTKFLTYIMKGILLGVAGFMYMFSNIKVANPDTLTSFGLIFEALMGTFIAGFLSRYSGLPVGIVVGVFSMKMLTTAMVACGMAATVRSLITGIFLLVLLCISSNQEKFIEGIQRRKIGKMAALEK